MTSPIRDIAGKIGATLAGGNPGTLITGVAPLDRAVEGQLSFLSNPKYLKEAEKTSASAVICQKDLPHLKAARLVTPNPYLAWAKAVALFAPDRSPAFPPGAHPAAIVDPSARLGKGVHVGAGACIGAGTVLGDDVRVHPGAVIEEECVIGEATEIHPNVVVHYGSRIGRRCVIWSGTVIGSYGFGYAQDGNRFVTIHQLGRVILEDDVDVGANCTIDRGAAGPTLVKRGTKIDNLVHLAHNVHVGEDCAITGQVGVSGSTVIGDRVKVGGQAGFVGHIEIGSDSFIGAKAGVSKSVPEKSNITGYPARDFMSVRRSEVIIGKLPEIVKRLEALEKRIGPEKA